MIMKSTQRMQSTIITTGAINAAALQNTRKSDKQSYKKTMTTVKIGLFYVLITCVYSKWLEYISSVQQKIFC